MFFKHYGRCKKVLGEIYYLDSVEHNFDNSWYQFFAFFDTKQNLQKIYKTTPPLIPSWANKNGQSNDIDPWHFNNSPDVPLSLNTQQLEKRWLNTQPW